MIAEELNCYTFFPPFDHFNQIGLLESSLMINSLISENESSLKLPPQQQELTNHYNNIPQIEIIPDSKKDLNPNRSKRGRKRRKETGEDVINHKKRIMELNRISAKKSRQRKSEYISKLEAEVNTCKIVECDIERRASDS